MLIKGDVSRNIRGSIPDCDKAKEFMKAVKKQFMTCDKALATILIQKLTNMKYDPSKGVHVHIMQLRNIASQLKSLKRCALYIVFSSLTVWWTF